MASGRKDTYRKRRILNDFSTFCSLKARTYLDPKKKRGGYFLRAKIPKGIEKDVEALVRFL